MEKFSRSVRRHHAARLKLKRKNHYRGSVKSPSVLGILAHTSKVCSCWMCGNPRHVFKDGLTVQERRFWQSDE